MKKFQVIILLSIITTIVNAQQTETRSIGSFKGVNAGEGVDVYLKKGDKESLKLEVSGTAPSNVITEISGSYLKIHMREGRYKDKTVKVYVTYVNLEKLSASSAASIYSEDVIKSKDLE